MEYNNPSAIVKDLNFGKTANERVVAGVNKLAKAVKSTGDHKRRCNRSRKRSLI